jgi:hypothetical protein
MYDSFIDQLSGLDLSGLSIRPAPFNETDFPCEDAIEQTLAAVWSDLFAMFSDTALEADAEDIAWGMVNLFHRAASRKSAQLDRASDEIRVLLASADGSEVHSSNLEEQVERAQAAEASMLAFEQMREAAAALYRDETGSSWKPVSGSRTSHSRNLTSTVIDAGARRIQRDPVGPGRRDFLLGSTRDAILGICGGRLYRPVGCGDLEWPRDGDCDPSAARQGHGAR